MTRGKTNAAANGNGRHHNFKTLSATPSNTNGKSKPILITGGAGFVGSNLAHRLLSAGRRVRVLDSLQRPGVEQNLQWLRKNHGEALEVVVGDIREADTVRQAMEQARQVFHFAAQEIGRA